ncbi:MAG: TIGR03013 family XrtA/PEP-CTERM system glycosyltransferase [Pseudomonadales bacterium]
MPHIRLFRHYIHTPMLLLSLAEGALVMLSAYLGYLTAHGEFPPVVDYLTPSIAMALVFVAAMLAMGVYESWIREGMTGMSLRTAVAMLLLGSTAMALLGALTPTLDIGQSSLLFATVCAFAAVTLFRLAVFFFLDEDVFKQRVLVLGIGGRARKIAARMRRRADQRAFSLHGFLDTGAGNDQISEFGVRILRTDQDLLSYCRANEIAEIVVAMDERRRNVSSGGGLPLEELMECRLSGISVCDVQQFIEREACKVDVDLLRPSWLVFSDGFVTSTGRAASKFLFDMLASLLLLALAWPLMLLVALLIKLEAPDQPVLYRQLRVGHNGRQFKVVKFRSMIPAAEGPEARWTARNDPRVTQIGNFIRKTRIDELPQLFNVLKGEMSFVGPRPERPVFVDELRQQIPFYDQRHRLKPGITGWAQLCYPYGASIDDAKEKLQYDLYYLKNHSLLLDLVIMLQTVEVVLIGEGAR